MKILMIFAFSILSVAAFGQAAPRKADSSGVTVVERRWSQTADAVPPEALHTSDDNPQRDSRAIVDNQRENEARVGAGQIALPPPVVPKRRIYNLPAAEPYRYEIKIRNDGSETIKEVTWEYVFSDPATRQELGRRHFVSKSAIRAGKEKRLKARSTFPPASIVCAAAAGGASGKNQKVQYAEQIEIKSVLYADGSVWQSK